MQYVVHGAMTHCTMPSFRILIIFFSHIVPTGAFSPFHSQVRNSCHNKQLPKLLRMKPVTPTESSPNWRVLTLPNEEESQENDALAKLQQRADWSQKEYQAGLEMYNKFMGCNDSYVAPGIRDALNCLDNAYRLYGPRSVICSFNGGKDAVVVFRLMLAAHANHYRMMKEQGKYNERVSIIQPRALYFEHKDEFPEVISYLKSCVANHDLDMVAFAKGIKFNEGLEVLVHHNKPRESSVAFPMAFVLGTRVGDPNAGDQGYFSPSSHYMPPFMRVNPILEWTYGQVWHFLRVFSLPYCSLYDQGYTSLGTIKDTKRCPALAVPGSSSSGQGDLPKYWPAYMLQDWSQERAGRINAPKDKEKQPEWSVTAEPPDAAPPSLQGSAITTVSVLRDTDPREMRPESTPDVNVSVNASSAPNAKETQDLIGDDSRSCYSYTSNNSLTQITAGLLVIGDEILKGATADTNSQVAAKAFREKSVLLKRVVVVLDDQHDIVNEILTMQHEVDVIVTSGGVGPTHDDVTIKSVANALGRDMELHEDMAKLLQEKMGKEASSDLVELTEAQRKMATLPSRSKLRYLSEDKNDWPVLQCRNIFVLPGVPEFFASKIEAVAHYVSSDAMERSAVYKVVLSVDEATIVSVLNSAVEEYPEVTFGSYPFVSHPEFKTVLTLEGRMRSQDAALYSRASFSKDQMDHHVRLALDYLLTHLPGGSILRVDNEDDLL